MGGREIFGVSLVSFEGTWVLRMDIFRYIYVGIYVGTCWRYGIYVGDIRVRGGTCIDGFNYTFVY